MINAHQEVCDVSKISHLCFSCNTCHSMNTLISDGATSENQDYLFLSQVLRLVVMSSYSKIPVLIHYFNLVLVRYFWQKVTGGEPLIRALCS